MRSYRTVERQRAFEQGRKILLKIVVRDLVRTRPASARRPIGDKLKSIGSSTANKLGFRQHKRALRTETSRTRNEQTQSNPTHVSHINDYSVPLSNTVKYIH